MDKIRFKQLAPIYYVCAIIFFFRKERKLVINFDNFVQFFNDSKDFRILLGSSKVELKKFLFDEAIKISESAGLIEISADEFGPSIFSCSDDFKFNSEVYLAKNPELQSKISAGGLEWLGEALDRIAKVSDQIGFSSDDLRAEIVDWSPIQFDADDSTTKDVIEKVEKSYDAIKESNGYADSYPNEREIVLGDIKSATESMKRGIIVFPTIKRLIESLRVSVYRLGKSSAGVICQSALEAFKLWIKQKGLNIISEIEKLF